MTDQLTLKETDLLPVGMRIRSRYYPELTGYIKGWEYNEHRFLSPIPYLIGWDDPLKAYRLLGWFFVYATLRSVEAL